MCYAGTVVHTKPKSQLASRIPLEVGAELYGDNTIESDIEVIRLMLATVSLATDDTLYLDIGHVDICRALVAQAELSKSHETALLDAYDRKARAEVNDLVSRHVVSDELSQMLLALVDLHGDIDVLDNARRVLSPAPASVIEAIDYIAHIVERLKAYHPELPIHIDLLELRGYQYHTGLVFAAYVDGIGHAVANGGRYDGIGKLFGRERAATGFSADVENIAE